MLIFITPRPLWSLSLQLTFHYLETFFIFAEIFVLYHQSRFVMLHSRYRLLKLNHRTKQEQAALRPPQVWFTYYL